MRRRDFLRATLVTSGAVLVGCGDKAAVDAAGKDAGTTDGATADSAIDSGVDTAADSAGTPPKDSDFFPQSIASGDPRPDGVILWTRVLDAAKATADLTVTLQLATDEAFANLLQLDGKSGKDLPARAGQDHCVKVRLAGLAAGKLWFYRFSYATAGKTYTSRTGRFKTAPAADEDVAVKFAVASCQDFNGKYYNSYARMLLEDLDFFVHLGDYVYETTGNPSFQTATEARRVKFTDTAGAIAFNKGTKDEYFAAKSLSNYRELYKTYRSDPDLQKAHEAMAMIAIGDDHEFSDDCHGATASYYDGAKDETDLVRRGAADQAWTEYMPIDFPAGTDFAFDPNGKFPDNLRAYRDFGYGKHVHVVMTDLRRYRADHLVPEDALPGAVMATEEELLAIGAGKLPTEAVPYFDVDKQDGGKYAKLLKDNAAGLEIVADKIKGLISAPWVNTRIDALNKKRAPGEQLPHLAEADLAVMKKGYAFHQLLKTSQYGSLGSRYLVTRKPFEAYAKVRWAATQGESEQVMGAAQEKWFLDTLKASTRTWKVWGNEYTLQRRVADLSPVESLPAAFRAEFLLSAEDWDGVPNRRDALLQAIAKVPNTVVFSGDIHAFFAGTPTSETNPAAKVVEFVSGAISSGTYQTLLLNQANSDPGLVAAGAGGLAYLASNLLLGKQFPVAVPPNPHLGYAVVDQHGFTKVEADAKTLRVTYFQTAESTADAPLPADKLKAAFQAVEFQVKAGESELYQKQGDVFKKWDGVKGAWV